jgi:hypothetical protein
MLTAQALSTLVAAGHLATQLPYLLRLCTLSVRSSPRGHWLGINAVSVRPSEPPIVYQAAFLDLSSITALFGRSKHSHLPKKIIFQSYICFH